MAKKSMQPLPPDEFEALDNLTGCILKYEDHLVSRGVDVDALLWQLWGERGSTQVVASSEALSCAEVVQVELSEKNPMQGSYAALDRQEYESALRAFISYMKRRMAN